MARANLETKLTLDTTSFQRNLTKAQAMGRKFSTGIKSLGKMVAKLGVAGIAAGAGIAAMSAAMAVGVKKAVDLGGRLSDVSARTGLAVKEIVLWEEAMRQGGLEAESLGLTVAKLNKNIGEAMVRPTGTQATAIEQMGIDMRELIRLSPGERFREILNGLKGVSDIAERSQIAEALLGRNGSKLFTVISDVKALQKATQTLGQGQIDLLDKNADRLDRVSDIMGGIGVKTRGFFIGLADSVLPGMESAAEKWEKLDFTSIGQKFGQAVSGILSDFGRKFADVLGLVINSSLVAVANAANPFLSDETKDRRQREANERLKMGLENITKPVLRGDPQFGGGLQGRNGRQMFRPLGAGFTAGATANMAASATPSPYQNPYTATKQPSSVFEVADQKQALGSMVAAAKLTNDLLATMADRLAESVTVQ